jgi:hypothetical protein
MMYMECAPSPLAQRRLVYPSRYCFAWYEWQFAACMSGSLLLVGVWACPDRVRRVCRALDWCCAHRAPPAARLGREEQRRGRFAACLSKALRLYS